METIQSSIDRLVEQIVQLAHPVRVVLFGSAARGDIGPDSDIDVLVVMPDGTHRRRTARRIHRGVRNVGIPFDVVVATPTDIEKHKENKGLIYRSILREGREVYVAS